MYGLFLIFTGLLAFAIMAMAERCYRKRKPAKVSKVPISVNYHLTRECNYSCGKSPSLILTKQRGPLHMADPFRILLPHRDFFGRRFPA